VINQFEPLRNIDLKSFVELERKGLGIAQIGQIKAAIEIGKHSLRKRSLTNIKVNNNKDVVNYFNPYLEDMKKNIRSALV
jgi:DNA repair protein RadC